MDHNLSSLAADIKAVLPSPSNTYSPRQDDTRSPAFILQQVVNGEYRKQMPSITHSTMVTSTPNNDTTMPSNNTQGGGEPSSSAYQQQSGNSHGNRGQANPCEAGSGCGGGNSSGAGGNGGDGNRRPERPADQEEDDTSHEQHSGETSTSTSSGGSVPHLIPSVAGSGFRAASNTSVLRRHNGSNLHQDHPTSQESLQSDNDSVGGISDATTAVVSDSDLRWQGAHPTSFRNHQSTSATATKSSSSSFNSSDPPTTTGCEALDVSSIATVSTLSSITNTSSSSSTEGKNILLRSASMHKENITHDSSSGSLPIETKQCSTDHSFLPSPPMSRSYRESDISDLDLTVGASEDALSSTPVESSAPLQLSEPLLVLETLEDDDNGDIIPPSPEAYGSNSSRIVPGSPAEIFTQDDKLACRQRHKESAMEGGSTNLEKAKETFQVKVAASKTSMKIPDEDKFSKGIQSDPSLEKSGVSAPTKLSDEQLSRGVEISPVKISPLQEPLSRHTTPQSTAVSRRIQFDSSTDESHDSISTAEKATAPPSHSKSDWPHEDRRKDYCATKTSKAESCDTNKSLALTGKADDFVESSDVDNSSSLQSSAQSKSLKLHSTVVTPIVHDVHSFTSPSLPESTQQLHLEDDSSTDEYDDEDDDPKNTFVQAESQGGIYEPLQLSDLDESISPDAVLVSAFHDIPIRPLVNVTRDKKEFSAKLVPVPSKTSCTAEAQLTMQNMQLHPPIVAESNKQTTVTAKTMTEIPLAEQLIAEEDPFAMLRQPDLSFGEMMLGLPGPSGVKRDTPPQPHHSDTDSDASESNVPQEPPKLSIRELLKSHELHSMIPMCGSVKGKGRGKRSKKNTVESTISLEESLRQEFTSIPQLLPPAYDPIQRPSPKPPDQLLHADVMGNQVFVSTDNEINLAIATELSLQEQHSLKRASHTSTSPSSIGKTFSKENLPAHSVLNQETTKATSSSTTTSTTTTATTTTTTTDSEDAKGQPNSEVLSRFSSVLKRKTRCRFSRQVNLRSRIVKGGLRKADLVEEVSQPSESVTAESAARLSEGYESVPQGKRHDAKKGSVSHTRRERRVRLNPASVRAASATAKKYALSKSLQKVTRSKRLLSSKGQSKRKTASSVGKDAFAAIAQPPGKTLKVPNTKRGNRALKNVLRPPEEELEKYSPIKSKRLRIEVKEKCTKGVESSQDSCDVSTQPVAQRVTTTTVITKCLIVEEFICEGKVVDKHCHQIEKAPVITRLVETVPPGCSPCTLTNSEKKRASQSIPIFRTPSNTSTSSSSITKTSSSGSLADVSSMGSSSSGTPYPQQRSKNKCRLEQDESPQQQLRKTGSLLKKNSDALSAMEIDLDKSWEDAPLSLQSCSENRIEGSKSQSSSCHTDSPLQACQQLPEIDNSSREKPQKQYSLRCEVPAASGTDRRKRIIHACSSRTEPGSSVHLVSSSPSRLQPSIEQSNEDKSPSDSRKHQISSKSHPDSNSNTKRKRFLNKPVLDDIKSSTPSAAKSSQSDIPADEDITGVKLISEGMRVFARWRDGCYYPGDAVSKDTKDRWIVKFDDGGTKSITASTIVGVKKLPAGTSVYAKTDKGDFECGIVQEHFWEQSALKYVVDLDTGKKLVVPCSFIMMTSDQVSCLLGNSDPLRNSEESSTINLKNVIEGNRRSRSAPLSTSSVESPSKITPSTPKTAHSPKDSTPKIPKSVKAQRRACPTSSNLQGSVDEQTPSPKRRRKGTPVCTTPLRNTPKAKSTPNRTPKLTHRSPVVEAQKEQSTVQDPSLGPIPPEGSRLFEGLIFVLTSADKPSRPARIPPEEASSMSSTDTTLTEEEIPASNPFSKSHLKLQIHTGGGIVLDEFDETVLNSIGDSFLISNAHVRTSKFLHCLAVGIPCVSHVWIINSCCRNKLQDHKAYFLPTGVSIMTKCLVEWHGRTKILAGLDICVSGNAEFVTLWTSIIKSSGAAVISRFPVLPSGKNAPALNIHAVVADRTCPSSTLRRCNKLGIPLVSIEWVVQCLIHGRRLGLDDHPKFTFDSLCEI